MATDFEGFAGLNLDLDPGVLTKSNSGYINFSKALLINMLHVVFLNPLL